MNILVTGGRGFLGRHVVDALKARGHQAFAFRSHEYDLRDPSHADSMFAQLPRLDAVVHLAAVVGGIGANRARPADFWRDNTLMGVHVLDACLKFKAVRFVLVGTTCGYPKVPPRLPFMEEDFWAGYPEETNAPYGIAKKSVMVGAAAYAQQYGLNTATLIPTNLYGPWDNFDEASSHVIPAIMRKMHEAKASGAGSVTLWGSGAPTRDFLYVEDAAEAVALAAEMREPLDPTNVGSGTEVSVRELAEMIRAVVGFEGKIEWDLLKPDGQPRRCLATDKARRSLGWAAKTRMDAGLAKTYEWFVGSHWNKREAAKWAT